MAELEFMKYSFLTQKVGGGVFMLDCMISIGPPFQLVLLKIDNDWIAL